MAPDYAELHCLSCYSFLRGASRPNELIERAKTLGYTALALTDECSFAGLAQAHVAAKAQGLHLIVGTELRLDDALVLVLLARNHDGYSDLCRLITQGRRAADKGEYRLCREDLCALGEGVLALFVPRSGRIAPDARDEANAHWVRTRFGERAWLAVELHHGADDAARLRDLLSLAQAHELPAVACGDVHMHARERRALQDTMSAIRLKRTVFEAGFDLFANGEHCLHTRASLARRYPAALLAETTRIAALCTFSMDALRYEYPREIVPEGLTARSYLRQLTERGITLRWASQPSATTRAQIERELELIADLNYEPYFLTVYDVVREARARGILCQGRGSAANSAVCFCLGITEVDPQESSLLFERFLSRARHEPPDIDVDFEHERREEVIQYIYGKYGRHRAALAATQITYRRRNAMRDVGKALGLSEDQLDRLTSAAAWWESFDSASANERLSEQGFDPDAPQIRRLLYLVRQLRGFPRHLSQHVGGFVISERPLHELVPVENATMPDRTVIQWDKDDLESLGLLKVDCLALGMLTCLRRCFDLVAAWRGTRWTIATLPKDDAATYAMIQRADTVGVFQIESRAQMSMLPRLKPRNFYDLVIEVAIVRPGPIQGNMVHPYLRRRNGEESAEPPSPELKPVLDRTCGVPIFQEQVMSLAMVAAGFTSDEADGLRRAMAAWKRKGGLEPYRDRLFAGMAERGYEQTFAERIFEQIKGFADYGFPESHAASFAKLAYASSWLKCHEPVAFTCALLNSLPMGFYGPAQLVQDLRRHGAAVRAPDVCYSGWDSSLEADTVNSQQPALRLGLRLLRGFPEDAAQRIVAARTVAPFRDVDDLVERARLSHHERTRLADAGALARLAGHRHRARWAAQGAHQRPRLLAGSAITSVDVSLAPATTKDDVLRDYGTLGLSLMHHPLTLIRRQCRALQALRSGELRSIAHGTAVRVIGLVIGRQHPQTASGATFVSLEDEDGVVNVVVWLALANAQRRELLDSRILGVDGVLEKVEGVQHLIARRLHCYDHLMPEIQASSRDFH
jgi:error-prone DNA polymerase